MKRLPLAAALAPAMLALTGSAAWSTDLRVEPVLLELNAPAASGMLSLRNEEDFAVSVQTRVFRWSQTDGSETLEPTDDVAASPPIVTLAPGTDYTVRVVRTSREPVRGEESYRVIVDQLPDEQRLRQSNVAILLRQSIPVFFRAARFTAAHVSWSLKMDRDRLVVAGANTGDERLRIASLRLRDAAGGTIAFGNGLVGYVLGRSSMNFIVPSPPRGFGATGAVSVTADSNDGAVHATAVLQARP